MRIIWSIIPSGCVLGLGNNFEHCIMSIVIIISDYAHQYTQSVLL